MLEIRSPHTLKIRPCRFSAQFEISNIKSRLPLYGTPRRRSKSYLTPPRWRGLGKRSTPVSPHITTRLRKVDENVDLAKFGRLHSAFPHLEFFLGALLVWGGRALPWGVGPAGLWVRTLANYLQQLRRNAELTKSCKRVREIFCVCRSTVEIGANCE